MIELYCTDIGAILNLGSIYLEKIGVTKEIDALGRIQIPKEIRKRLGLDKTVELVVTCEGLLIRSEEYLLIRKSPQNKNSPTH